MGKDGENRDASESRSVLNLERDPVPHELRDWIGYATAGLAAYAQARIELEVLAHFESAKADLIADGLTEKDAEQGAIEALGDPHEARREFGRTYLEEAGSNGLARTLRRYRRPRLRGIPLVVTFCLVIFAGLGVMALYISDGYEDRKPHVSYSVGSGANFSSLSESDQARMQDRRRRAYAAAVTEIRLHGRPMDVWMHINRMACAWVALLLQIALCFVLGPMYVRTGQVRRLVIATRFVYVFLFASLTTDFAVPFYELSGALPPAYLAWTWLPICLLGGWLMVGQAWHRYPKHMPSDMIEMLMEHQTGGWFDYYGESWMNERRKIWTEFWKNRAL